MDAKKIGIVGAGISGLIACKYVREKGFIPIVFEMKDMIGGVWLRTLDYTLLQTPKIAFQFSDFPWPSSVTSDHPTHGEVLEYIQSYARQFQLLQYIQFNSQVVGVEFVKDSCSSKDGVLPSMSDDAWSGEPFSSGGTWQITVHNVLHGCSQVHTVDFVIICTGRYGDIPKWPLFVKGRGPEVFKGKVIHAVDLYSMEPKEVDNLITGKRIVVVGFLKSAIDIAAKCANINGMEFPCTLICRKPLWHFPGTLGWTIALAFLYGTRFSELLDHKPGESLFFSLLATVLSPLRWGLNKLVELCLQWQFPLKKFGILPEEGVFQQIASCHVAALPENLFTCLEEGSIVIKKSESWAFYDSGLMLENENEPVEADIVIFATGCRATQKLKNIFKSSIYQQFLSGSESSIIPLYRECIHPWIPRMAVIGHTEAVSNLFMSEMEVRWLVCLLTGGFRLPNTKEMEEDMRKWYQYKENHGGCKYNKSSISAIQIWYNDKLCEDMGCNPRRKKNWFLEFFSPYGPADYSNLKIL
ncbi:probable flavin-containing monooxygenase 1 [Nymphaea colorata]|nr:probable flavin-containing monooxygenase 1 [Nymphaea colorata]